VGAIGRGPGKYGASAVRKAIEEAAADREVDAIVLRLDSGGGDVVASDMVSETVRRCQETSKKPVVASFGNTAASGAYFIACACQRILAQQVTITGSIGVATLRPHLTPEFLNHVGLNVEIHATGSRINSLFHELEGEALARYKRQVDGIYEDFLKRVAQSRNMSMEQMHAVAGGRVFTGRDAFDLGLVDAEGGVYEALFAAAELGLPASVHPVKLDYVLPKVFPKRKPLLERLAEASAMEEMQQQLKIWAKEIMLEALFGVVVKLARDEWSGNVDRFLGATGDMAWDDMSVNIH